jgi:hypothetical protein
MFGDWLHQAVMLSEATCTTRSAGEHLAMKYKNHKARPSPVLLSLPIFARENGEGGEAGWGHVVRSNLHQTQHW